MALTDPSQSRTTDMNTELTNYTAGSEPWNLNQDGYLIDEQPTESMTYQCDWAKWHGMYRTIAELRSTIDTECRWIIGKEITFKDAKTREAAKRIKGKGRETIRKILLNIKRVSKICGDCYAWAPRDKAGRLINLKILDPSTIQIQADKFGIIKKYVQVSIKNDASKINANSNKGKSIKKGDEGFIDEFEPKEILHIMNDPIGDEIHGIPEGEKLIKIIKKLHQGMDDYTTILHRYGKPTFFYEANTDDETELEDIKNTIDQAQKNFENAVLPKGTLEKIDRVATPQYSSLDPLPWFKMARSYFTESSNVPDLVRGKSDEVSLAAGKLNFVAFKEKVRMQQLEFQEELEEQLGLKIEFEKPVEIDVEIARDPEEMDLKKKAKKQKGGNQIITETKKEGTAFGRPAKVGDDKK